MTTKLMDRKTEFPFQIEGGNARQNLSLKDLSNSMLNKRLFVLSANTVSEYIPAVQNEGYQARIEQWGAEFDARRHVLTKKERDALESDVLADFLQNMESLS